MRAHAVQNVYNHLISLFVISLRMQIKYHIISSHIISYHIFFYHVMMAGWLVGLLAGWLGGWMYFVLDSCGPVVRRCMVCKRQAQSE